MFTSCYKIMINIYFRWFVLWEWISQSNITSKANPEMWDATRSQFWAKHINDSMFINIHKCAGTIVCFMSRQLVQLFVSCLVSWYNCLFHVSPAGTIVCFMSRQLVQLFVSCLVSCVNHTHSTACG
jgi:hypothetical protein